MDSPLADAWDELARASDTAAAQAAWPEKAAHEATAATYRKCARQLRSSGADRNRGIVIGDGNTQINSF